MFGRVCGTGEGSGGGRCSSSSLGSSSRRPCGVRLPPRAPRRCPRPIPRPPRRAPRPPPTPLRARIRLRATSPRPRKARVAPILRPPTSRRRPAPRPPRSYPFRARHRFPPRRTRACRTRGASTRPPRVRRMLVNADGRKHHGPHRSWKGWEPDHSLGDLRHGDARRGRGQAAGTGLERGEDRRERFYCAVHQWKGRRPGRIRGVRRGSRVAITRITGRMCCVATVRRSWPWTGGPFGTATVPSAAVRSRSSVRMARSGTTRT